MLVMVLLLRRRLRLMSIPSRWERVGMMSMALAHSLLKSVDPSDWKQRSQSRLTC